MIQTGQFGPLYLKQNREFTVGGKSPTATTAQEAEVYQAMADALSAATSHVQMESDDLMKATRRLHQLAHLGPTWGPDLDPSPNRIVKTFPRVESPRLEGGLLSAGMVLELDEERKPLRLSVESEQGNYRMEAVWRGDRLAMLEDYRKLADGTEERYLVKTRKGGGYQVQSTVR